MTSRRHARRDHFETTKIALTTIVGHIREGDTQLLDFQREWRWKETGVAQLLSSIAQGHPVGAIMLLETGGEAKFGFRPLEGALPEAASKPDPRTLVLDGQQRLTACGTALSHPGAVPITTNQTVRYRRFFIDMRRSIDATADMDDAIVVGACDALGNLHRGQYEALAREAVQYERLMFPVSEILDSRRWVEGFTRHYEARPEDERREAMGLLNDFRQVVEGAFLGCDIPVIRLRREIGLEAVCRVYERLNTAGVQLNSYDLIIARFAGEGINLRREWDGDGDADACAVGITSRIAQETRNLISGIEPVAFLNAVRLLRNLDEALAPSSKSKLSLLDLTPAQYQRHREKTIAGFRAATMFLKREKISSPEALPSMTVVACMVAILAHLGDASEVPMARQRLTRWFWHAVFSKRINSYDPVAQDLVEVCEWARGGEVVPKVFADHPIIDRSITGAGRRVSDIFRGAVTATIRHGALDPRTGHAFSHESELVVVPVFPLSECKSLGVETARAESVVNSIVLPKETVDRLKKTGLGLAEGLVQLFGHDETHDTLASQGVDLDALARSDFDAVWSMRAAHVIGAVERQVGNRLIRSDEVQDDQADDWPERASCRMDSRDSLAHLAVEGGKLTVLAGSIMSKDMNPSVYSTYRTIREDLINSGVAQRMGDGRYVLTKDIEVSAVTAASASFSGRIVGKSVWRGRDGKLFDFDAALAA